VAVERALKNNKSEVGFLNWLINVRTLTCSLINAINMSVAFVTWATLRAAVASYRGFTKDTTSFWY
jgi:hypothetical protein